jgi:hypothetical protein
MSGSHEEMLMPLAETLVSERLRKWLLLYVWIDGIEVTQSIQYYGASQHLTDPNDRGPDDSVRLVANKPAWVRVYLRARFSPGVSGITGELLVERRRFGFLYTAATTISPQPPGSVTAQQTLAYVVERSNVANTLNFVIPANEFWGLLRLTVSLRAASGTPYDSETIYIDATLRQTLRLRGIFVSYNGPSTANVPLGSPPPPTITLAAPTLANLQSTAALALRSMPVQSTGVFTSAGTMAWGTPIDDPRSSAGACSTNWNLLLTALGNQRNADGNRSDVVYFGLLPTGIPIGVPGCGVGGLGAGRVGDPNTLRHEIGHGYGFQHTPCGAAGATDPNYPTYEPYPSASIGEYALDISNGNVFSPQNTSDYMSYCFPQWMSLYQHDRLILHSRLAPEWVRDEPWWKDYVHWRDYVIPDYIPDPPPDPWQWMDVRQYPVIALSGIVHSPDEVEVLTVARVNVAGRPPGESTTLRAHLLGEEGRIISRAPVYRLNAQGGCGCGGEDDDPDAPYAFQAYIADVAPGSALVITDRDRRLWERQAHDERPRIVKVEASATDDGRLRLRWEASAAREHEVWVQWSADDGKSWRALTTGLSGYEATVDLSGLPAGEVLVRILLHDGFWTAASEPIGVQVPERPPEVSILHPADGQTLIAGGTMQLWAAVADSAGGPLEDASIVWFLDGREVADEAEVWLEAPEEGEHEAIVRVRAKSGQTEQRVTFRTVGGAFTEAAENA